ncbi:biotin carboxylase N-terminal domain-containing protein [Niveibacterium sp. SC-1]|uniref:ATP-binding protein n=1 Tax=Niveibacterium sp. SC-1 TaxID=3135646 RepID=UPI00311F165A
MRPFDSVLIANRGEIACRILRSVKALGLRGIAVFSDADAGALHVRQADQALRIGPAEAAASYLSIPALLAAARASGAQAVHPGYGFLSENAGFAEACAAAGLVFIGPPVEAIRLMGDKSRAKACMAEAGVPVLADYRGEDQTPTTLAAAAQDLGFPLLIKPRLGGGGKGMRIVENGADFLAALTACQREAQAAFGDAGVLLEPYLRQARHIEVQVFADHHGHCVHLFERDCSLQRRHQKIIEEAPAPGLSATTRSALHVAACRAAQAVGYVGAGTVEFLLAPDGRFFFMEMNTRLQVEHPVTECVTGLDLVDWQLRVAQGEPLPLAQGQITCRGHAIEARVYAEDPARGFLPSAGLLETLVFPHGPGLRVDSGVTAGERVSTHYDPMLAKLIAWGEDRAEALRRLRAAVCETRILGPRHNLGFVARLLDLPAFVAAQADTQSLGEALPGLLAAADRQEARLPVLASLAWLLHEAAARHDPSPWAARDGWRLGGRAQRSLHWRTPEDIREVQVRYAPDHFALRYAGAALEASGELKGEQLQARIGTQRIHLQVYFGPGRVALFLPGDPLAHVFELQDPFARDRDATAAQTDFRAPMPGRIIALPVSPGQEVAPGAILAVMEAMKMEHSLRAPAAGVLRACHVRVGEAVAEGVLLLDFEAHA